MRDADTVENVPRAGSRAGPRPEPDRPTRRENLEAGARHEALEGLLVRRPPVRLTAHGEVGGGRERPQHGLRQRDLVADEQRSGTDGARRLQGADRVAEVEEERAEEREVEAADACRVELVDR